MDIATTRVRENPVYYPNTKADRNGQEMKTIKNTK